MKTFKELVDVESSWQVVKDLMANATNNFEILPKNDKMAEKALVELQQSTASLMGAVTYETGGILIDNGWLRVLGSGHEKLTRTIANWNLGRSYENPEDTPGFLMIADDVLGGIFAVNGTELGDDVGNLYYLAPDTLEWEPLEVSYHDFLSFCFTGQIKDFYENYRWNGWEEETKKVSGDEALLIMPPLWAEGPDDIGERDRQAIPMDEAFEFLMEACEIESEMYSDDDDEDFDDEDDEHSCCCGGDDCDCDDDCDDCDCDCDCDCDDEEDEERK
jgi:hypothetical protein